MITVIEIEKTIAHLQRQYLRKSDLMLRCVEEIKQNKQKVKQTNERRKGSSQISIKNIAWKWTNRYNVHCYNKQASWENKRATYRFVRASLFRSCRFPLLSAGSRQSKQLQYERLFHNTTPIFIIMSSHNQHFHTRTVSNVIDSQLLYIKSRIKWKTRSTRIYYYEIDLKTMLEIL